jgi:hypothetical protein
MRSISKGRAADLPNLKTSAVGFTSWAILALTWMIGLSITCIFFGANVVMKARIFPVMISAYACASSWYLLF